MTEVLCLAEQQEQPAVQLLAAAARVTVVPLSSLADAPWLRPLFLPGDGLRLPGASGLLKRTAQNPAPLVLLPPLPLGELAEMLAAPAPVSVVRGRADRIELSDESLRRAVGRASLQVLCNEVVETALTAGVMAVAEGRPVIWAYHPTRASTPVLIVAPQLLLLSARTDPLDREDLLAALLGWADSCVRSAAAAASAVMENGPTTPAAADPALLRAVVVAWTVRPDLPSVALSTWLAEHLFVSADEGQLRGTVQALKALHATDDEGRPDVAGLKALVEDWGLRAWVREASRMEAEA